MFEQRNKTLAVYLSGSIQKGHDKGKEQGYFWGEEEKKHLSEGAESTNFIFLDPSNRNDDLNDFTSILGRDMLQVIISDAVLVDARDKRGIGVGAEIDRAETQNVPVVAIVPENTVYHKFNTTILDQNIIEWKHPFIFGYAEHVAKNFKEAGKEINENINPRLKIIPNHINDRILSAMQHYIRTQLSKDTPMQELYNNCPIIRNRIDIINKMSLLNEYKTVSTENVVKNSI